MPPVFTATDPDTDRKRWLPPRIDGKGELLLVCLPYAGAGASLFRGWAALTGQTMEVCPLRLPAREMRHGEAPITDCEEMVRQITEVLVPVTGRPYALFGHSMGAMLAYEVAVALQKRGLPRARHLFLSGRQAPCIQHEMIPLPVGQLSDTEFVGYLRQIDKESAALDDPELQASVLPALRADFMICQSYRDREHTLLEVPITAFLGREDPFVARAEIEPWSRYTSGQFQLHLVEGGHFFIRNPRGLIRTIASMLAVLGC